MDKQNETNEQNIKNHYKWFCDSCNKRKEKPISYKQFKKEFIGMSNKCLTNYKILIKDKTDLLLSKTIKGKYKRSVKK